MSSRNFWRRRSNGPTTRGAAALFVVLCSASPSRSAEIRTSALPEARAKWSDIAATPIGVWIQPVDARTGRSFVAALDAWSQAIPITFEIVGDSANADVRVMWPSELTDPATGASVNGLSRYTVNESSRIIGADVFIAPRRPNGRALSGEALEAIAMHEVGHVLGLRHSSDSSDVMFPTVQVRGLSTEDIAAASRLYGTSELRAEELMSSSELGPRARAQAGS